jgi:hypothetical protein
MLTFISFLHFKTSSGKKEMKEGGRERGKAKKLH